MTSRKTHRRCGLTDNCPKFADAARPQLVITWNGLDPHWHGRPERTENSLVMEYGLQHVRMCGLHFTAAEMRELVAMGIKDACRLLQGLATHMVLRHREDVAGLSLLREPPQGGQDCLENNLQFVLPSKSAAIVPNPTSGSWFWVVGRTRLPFKSGSTRAHARRHALTRTLNMETGSPRVNHEAKATQSLLRLSFPT
eukprot:2978891-Amphidinium_carterae.1